MINAERKGTEWNGMENVNKIRNGTAESAQSTPTHPWPTKLGACKTRNAEYEYGIKFNTLFNAHNKSLS